MGDAMESRRGFFSKLAGAGAIAAFGAHDTAYGGLFRKRKARCGCSRSDSAVLRGDSTELALTEPPYCGFLTDSRHGGTWTPGAHDAGGASFRYTAILHAGNVNFDECQCAYYNASYSAFNVGRPQDARTLQFEAEFHARRFPNYSLLVGFFGRRELGWISVFPVAASETPPPYDGSSGLASDNLFYRWQDWWGPDWTYNGYRLGVRVKTETDGTKRFKFLAPTPL